MQQSTQRDIWHGDKAGAFTPLQGTSLSGKFVMIIDDSATVRKIVETCLAREGFEVKGFANGVEAIHWLTEPNSRLPEIIILDIMLPQIDGYEVARLLKSNTKFNTIIIIMLTRCDGILDRLKCRLVGAKDYITKPFKTQELVTVIEKYLGTPIYEEANRPY
jgi:twitching motility two-component system response regulator PilG